KNLSNVLASRIGGQAIAKVNFLPVYFGFKLPKKGHPNGLKIHRLRAINSGSLNAAVSSGKNQEIIQQVGKRGFPNAPLAKDHCMLPSLKYRAEGFFNLASSPGEEI